MTSGPLGPISFDSHITTDPPKNGTNFYTLFSNYNNILTNILKLIYYYSKKNEEVINQR
jgi:hypothetical protein